MFNVYIAADNVISEYTSSIERTGSMDIAELTKLVDGAYILFCSMATEEVVSDLKCKIIQLIVSCNLHGVIGNASSRELQAKVNIAAESAISDMKVPIALAVQIKSLLKYGVLEELSYDSLDELESVVTLFSLPILLRTYASDLNFKQYLYAMLYKARTRCEDSISSDTDLRLALRLGSLSGVYTASMEDELLSIIDDKDVFLNTCHKTIFDDISETNVFGGGQGE